MMTNNGRTFYHTVDYPHCELYKIDLEDVIKYVMEKLPTMKYRKDVVLIMENDNDNPIILKQKKMEKKYRVTMTESQLRLMSDAVEDWHRFLAGQCEMYNATSYIEDANDMHECRRTLDLQVRPYVVHRGSGYNWSGMGCPNKHQRKAIAMSYMIYREVLHYLTTHNGKDMSWNTYNSETLTCEEQGPMITIEEVK